MSTIWARGVKCVCIHNVLDLSGLICWPVKGDVLTVRDVVTHPFWGNTIGLLFDGIFNPTGRIAGPFSDWPFDSSRFRPLVETKYDISIFTRILDDANRRIPVPVE